MAVTNLQDRVHPGKVILARDMQGNGDPVHDPILNDMTKFPIGTTFLDLDTGDLYTKTEYNTVTKATTWTVAAGSLAGS